MTDTFAQLLVSGCALGAIYALTALGFVVIYRASAVFNFAQGEFVTVGALTMVSLVQLGLPWPLALLGTMTLTGALAAGIERVVLRPLVGRPVFTTVIVTIFVGLLLRAGALVGWGTDTFGMPT
ncbi:MAG: branched-chain amino acid ABC transporter permease, partial [Myxococcota bacterium]